MEALMQVKRIMAIILLVLLLINIPITIYVLRVHHRFGRQTTFKFLIKTLLVIDLIICVTSIARLGVTVHMVVTSTYEDLCVMTDQLLTQAIKGQSICAASVIATIAADRYEALCRLNIRFLTTAKAKVVVLLVGTLSVLWTAGDMVGTIEEKRSWNKIAVCISTAIFAIIVILVVGVYIKICMRMRNRAKVRANLRKCYKCTVISGYRRKGPGNPHGGHISSENADNLSNWAISSVTQYPVSNELGHSSSESVPRRVVATPEGAPGTLTLHKTTAKRALKFDNTNATPTRTLALPTMDGTVTQTVDNTSATQTGTLRLSPKGDTTIQNTLTINDPMRRCPRRLSSTRVLGRCNCSENGPAVVKISKVLILTTLVHIISWCPSLAYDLVLVLHEPPRNSALHITMWVVDHLCYVNVALNPFIYGLANREFRWHCREVIRRDFGI